LHFPENSKQTGIRGKKAINGRWIYSPVSSLKQATKVNVAERTALDSKNGKEKQQERLEHTTPD